MSLLARTIAPLSLVAGLLLSAAPSAPAQCVGPATAFYAPQPVVTYYPEVRGLLFRRVVYRPVINYPAVAAAAPVTTTPSPPLYHRRIKHLSPPPPWRP